MGDHLLRPSIHHSSPGGPPATQIGRTVLHNGLRVASIALPHLHTSQVSVFVRCGSRHETPESNGISHLLEHLLFRGSERFPDARALAVTIENAAGELQGAAARDHTVLQTPVHPAKLEVPFAVLSDLVCRPLLREPELELERQVILEELASESDAEGRQLDLEHLTMGGLFGASPLAWPIGGDLGTLLSLREEDVRAWHRRAWGARNLVVVCGGPAPHSRVVELAARYFGAMPPGEPFSDGPPPPLAEGLPKVTLVDRPGGQTQIRLAFRCPPQQHPAFPCLRLLRRLLADGLSSRLQVELVEKRALAYAAGAALNGFSDCALFTITAVCTPSKVLALVSRLLELLSALATTRVAAEDLLRVQAKSRLRNDFMLDSPSEVVEWLGLGDLLHGGSAELQTWLDKLEAVTAKEVRDSAAMLFRRGGLVACCVGPLGQEAEEINDLLQRAEPLPR